MYQDRKYIGDWLSRRCVRACVHVRCEGGLEREWEATANACGVYSGVMKRF